MDIEFFDIEKNITGNVVRILDDKRLVINIGFNDGLKLNDKIIVYEIGENVKNIDGKIIGTLDYIKAELVVTNLYDNIAICQYPKKNVTAFENSVSSISSSFISYQKQESLNVDKNDIEPYERTHSDIIHVGDNVKKILTND